MVNTTTFCLGALDQGLIKGNGVLLWFAFHLRTDWHQAGAAGPTEWLAVHKQRFAILFGGGAAVLVAAGMGRWNAKLRAYRTGDRQESVG